MNINKLIVGLAFSILASSAFALPVSNAHSQISAPVVAENGASHTNIGRLAADGADHVGANRLAADGADHVGANRVG